MNVLIGLLIFNLIIVGFNFIFLLIGGPPWHKGDEFEDVHVGKKTYTLERFVVGIAIGSLGVSYFATWIYFMTAKSLTIEILTAHWLHILLHLITGVLMMVAAYSIFNQWKRNKGLFISSVLTLIFTTFTSLLIYGPQGHGLSTTPMVMFAIGITILGGYLTTAIYVLGRFIHHYDERLEPEDKMVS